MMSTRTRRIARPYCIAANRMFLRSNNRPLTLLCALTATRTPALATRTCASSTNFSTFSDGNTGKSSPFASKSPSQSKKRPRRKFKFVPQKAAVALTPKARNFFRALLESTSNPEVAGIMLNYHQSSTGEPRMVFSFDFAKAHQLTDQDEGVSLEVMEDGVTPKTPEESENDGLPKLYVHHNAFMKVLGCTLDVDEANMVPILYDREGNKLDPNA